MFQETPQRSEFYVRSHHGDTLLTLGMTTRSGLSEIEKRVIEETLEHGSTVTQFWLVNMLMAIRAGTAEREARRIVVVSEEEMRHHQERWEDYVEGRSNG